MEEIAGRPRHEDDVILICKRFMADPEPYRVITLVSAEQAATFRKSMVQPVGIAPKKAISTKIKQQIHGKVGPLMTQGFLTQDAAAYLTNWADGTLQPSVRPASYLCLTYRFEVMADRGIRIPWEPPRRQRHIDLKPEEVHDPEAEASGGSDDLEPAAWLATCKQSCFGRSPDC